MTKTTKILTTVLILLVAVSIYLNSPILFIIAFAVAVTMMLIHGYRNWGTDEDDE